MKTCTLEEILFDDPVSGTANTLTILAIAKFAIKKNIFGDAEQLVDNVLGKSGLIASFASLVKNIREGDATLNDYASVASATAQTALNVAKLAGKKVGPVAAAFIIFDMINLLHQYFSCEPSKKGTPTTDPAQRQNSPLVIDLGFNGIETLASNRGIYFDLDNNGFAENTAWVRYTDGLLALDLNNNGLIDNGSELFGNHFVLQNGQKAANGFEALKEFDTDGNMSINHLDEIWNRLKIWQDLNRDGITQEGELKDLSLSGIQAINLNYLEKDNFDSNGNNHRQQSTVQWNDGKTSSINDVWFNVHLADTIDLSEVNISDELQSKLDKLPDVNGFGNLSRLQIAMAKNPALLEKVQHYLNSDFEVRKTLINDLIYEWAGCIDIDPKSRDPKSHYGHVIDARKVITLEVLTGHGYVGTWCWGEKDPNPHGQAAPLLNAEFNKFADYVSAYLSAQWEYSDIFEDIFHSMILNMGNSNSEQHSDVLNNKIENLLKTQDFLEIKKILNVAEHLGAYNAFIRNAWSNELQILKSHFSELNSLFDDTFFNGTDGNDSVYGKNTDDFLMGGLGNDQLYGKEGSDIYAFGQNFGRDKIYDNKGQDAVLFIDSNIKPENIIMRRVKENFNSIELIEIDDLGHESGNRIQIDNFFDFSGNLAEGAIETIRFNDSNKTTWNIETIRTKLLSATIGDDYIHGYSSDDVINGDTGNDILSGNIGADTYVFTQNFGQDTIIEADANNSIRFNNISPTSLKLYRNNNDLIIKQIGSENHITIRNQFRDMLDEEHPTTLSNHIIQILFDDGTVWDDTKIKQLAVIGTDKNENINGFYDNDALIGGYGNDVLNGQIGQDTYVFAPNWGQDKIIDKDANSIILFHDIEPSDIRLLREGNSLIVTHLKSNDRITIDNHFKNESDQTTHNRIIQIIFDDKTIWDTAMIKNQILTGTNESEYLNNSFIEGGDLHGLAGNDYLQGGNQKDTLFGEEGNDELNGGSGSDTFVFAKGWGQDIIQSEYNKLDQDIDTILLTDIYSDEILLRYEWDNLILRRLNSDDQITIRQQFGIVPTINQITFADGSTWSIQDIYTNTLKSTDANDTITAISATDEIHGGKGNDSLIGLQQHDAQNRLFGEKGDDTLTGTGLLDGGEGNDTLSGSGQLYGKEGNDHLSGNGVLYGGAGNDSLTATTFYHYSESNMTTLLDGGDGEDTLDAGSSPMRLGESGVGLLDPIAESQPTHILRGGKGNDTLYGSYADDVYEFNLGDGHDTLIECKSDAAYSNIYASYDVIRFGENISMDDILFIHQGNDLVMKHRNGQDSITVQNHYNSSNAAVIQFKIDEVRFADGTVLSRSQFENRIVWQGTDAGEQMLGRDEAEIIYAGQGDDRIWSKGGNDTIYGEAGNDYINSGVGDDKLYGGEGNDQLRAGTGSDILNGGSGDDYYVYHQGDGQDTLDLTGGGRDILFFQDVSRERLDFIKDGDDLLIKIDKDIAQSVRIEGHFLGGEKAIAIVQPAGGYALTSADIASMLKVSTGTTNPPETPKPTPSNPTNPTQPAIPVYTKTIKGNIFGNTLRGTAENDLIQGLNGNDKLYGLAGQDRLEGGNGADTLEGGTGNDILLGGAHNDTYVFATGFGQDVIDNSGGGTDKIQFQNIRMNQVSQNLMRVNDDLILKVAGTQDQVTIQNWFKGGDKTIANIVFSDGALTAAQVNQAFVSIATRSRSAEANVMASTNNLVNAMSAFGSRESTAMDSSVNNNVNTHPLSYLTASI